MTWLPKENVVVPVDFSDESFAAVEQALNFVDSPRRIHVIHVLPDLVSGEPGMVWGTVDEDSRREHAKTALREKLSDARFEGIDVIVGFGDPAHEVADYAKSTSADLIVLPSHGRTGIARFLIGSVAERVVRLAPCSVVVLRG